MGGTRRRADPQEQAVLLRLAGSATTSATAASTPTRCRPPGCATATSAKCWRSTRPSGSTIPRRAMPTGTGRCVLRGRDHSGRSHQRRSPRTIQALYPGAEQRRHEQRPAEQPVRRARTRRPIRDNYDVKVNWNRNSAHQIWAKFSVMDAVGAGPVLPADRRRRRRRHEGLPLHGRPDLDAQPDAAARRQRRLEQDDPSVGRARTSAPTSASTRSAFPAEQRRRDRSRLGRSASATAACRSFNTGLSTARQRRRLDAGVAQGSQLHGLDQPHQGQRPPRDPTGLRLRPADARPLAAGSRPIRAARSSFAGSITGTPGYAGESAAGTAMRPSCSAR